MELQQLVQVDIRHAVAVGDHEAVAVDILGNAFDAAALEGFLAGVAERHPPVLDMAGDGR